MITITICQNQVEDVVGFSCIGHAGYAEEGQDIICAGVSALVINTINSIDAFTSVEYSVGTDPETGLIDFQLKEYGDHDVKLLIDSMILGLQGIQKDYGNDYVILNFKEV